MKKEQKGIKRKQYNVKKNQFHIELKINKILLTTANITSSSDTPNFINASIIFTAAIASNTSTNFTEVSVGQMTLDTVPKIIHSNHAVIDFHFTF